VWVAGTTASDEHGDVHGDDAYSQAQYILAKIEVALRETGASLQDVVRTRMYLSNIDDWEAVCRAHGEVFSAIRPASTLVAVAALVSGRLVEIEVDAVIGRRGGLRRLSRLRRLRGTS
jgi:enamine deaminase RidA (YjgF/YER057c/UK114 family)